MKIKVTKSIYTKEENEYDLNIGDIVEFIVPASRYVNMKYSKAEVKYISLKGNKFLVDDKSGCYTIYTDKIFKINGLLIKEDFSNKKGWKLLGFLGAKI